VAQTPDKHATQHENRTIDLLDDVGYDPRIRIAAKKSASNLQELGLIGLDLIGQAFSGALPTTLPYQTTPEGGDQPALF